MADSIAIDPVFTSGAHLHPPTSASPGHSDAVEPDMPAIHPSLKDRNTSSTPLSGPSSSMAVDTVASPEQASNGAGDANLQANLPTGNSQWAWTCDRPGCGKKYKYESSLIDHMRVHDGTNPFTCGVCGKEYHDKKGLTQHTATHKPDDERAYQCDWEGCGKGFTRKDHLIRHRRTHTGERLFACKIANCGKTFVQKEALKIHMRRHTGERPYVCDLCGKDFNDPSGLHHHRGKHIEPDERPFRCEWPGCDKAYHAQYALNSHMKLHARPRGCSSRRTSASTASTNPGSRRTSLASTVGGPSRRGSNLSALGVAFNEAMEMADREAHEGGERMEGVVQGGLGVENGYVGAGRGGEVDELGEEGHGRASTSGTMEIPTAAAVAAALQHHMPPLSPGAPPGVEEEGGGPERERREEGEGEGRGEPIFRGATTRFINPFGPAAGASLGSPRQVDGEDGGQR